MEHLLLPDPKLTDAQITLLNLIDYDTFCEIETDMDFGRDEIFKHIFALRARNGMYYTADVNKFKDYLRRNICSNPEVLLLITCLMMGPVYGTNRSVKSDRLFEYYRNKELARFYGKL